MEYRKSEGLGPLNTSKCPHCQNSLQNAVPNGSPELLRCANCKNIFHPYLCQLELIRMIQYVSDYMKPRNLTNPEKILEAYDEVKLFADKLYEKIKYLDPTIEANALRK